MKFVLILIVIVSAPAFSKAADRCTYWTWTWDTIQKKSVDIKKVEKPYSEITEVEKDKNSACTVCEQDQVELTIPGFPKVKVCKHFEKKIKNALMKIKSSGFPVEELIAYRVGKSRGKVDKNGLRTEFSNHSFGTAIDVNANKNGLYGNCIQFNKSCKLRRGGEWKPGAPGTIEKGSLVYRAFIDEGFKWGGELYGRQKDFMHFSLKGN